LIASTFGHDMHHAPRVILFLEATRGFNRGILSGIARYAALNGPWTFYRRPHDYLMPRADPDIAELKAWKPDGAVCPVSFVKEFSRLRIPLIAFDVNEYAGRAPRILSADTEAGRFAAQHLLDLGHRRFAFCGYHGIRWSRDRCQAFCEAVNQAGHAAEIYKPTSHRRATWAKEEPRIRHWLESLPKPIGMLCANDDRAASLLETCRMLGFGVPEDVSVIGVDDDLYICELQNPPLSSVRMASDRAGYEAAELLHQMMDGGNKMASQRIVAHATGVTVRHSTSVLMIRDNDVRKAMRFIRENANRFIRVADVVNATDLSHRTLNERFHQECGGSIIKQLTRARIAHISNLLTETQMRIHEIATMVGYEDDRHFARYFKRATGLTPQAFRRKHSSP
jgi:LacI family transcriptional regulator